MVQSSIAAFVIQCVFGFVMYALGKQTQRLKQARETAKLFNEVSAQMIRAQERQEMARWN